MFLVFLKKWFPRFPCSTLIVREETLRWQKHFALPGLAFNSIIPILRLHFVDKTYFKNLWTKVSLQNILIKTLVCSTLNFTKPILSSFLRYSFTMTHDLSRKTTKFRASLECQMTWTVIHKDADTSDKWSREEQVGKKTHTLKDRWSTSRPWKRDLNGGSRGLPL